jgi:non-specific serine/threonine protein kinase
MLREADAHFTRTGEIFDRFRLPWEEAETLLLWGLALNVTGDARASEKFDAAIMVYRRHGAGDRWLEHARSLRKPARRRATGRSAEPVLEVQSTFRKEGDFWTVTHDGRAFRLRDMKGLAYIAHLIAHPGVRIHARDLVAIVEGPAPDGATTSIGRAYADGLGAASDLGDAGEALDAQAVSSYRRRLLEVRAELAEAENNNDLGATERARHELEALSNQLAGGVGRRGRVRRSSSHVERARAAVTKNIRAGVERIRRNDAKLGEHFAASIRTGAFCAYLPDLKNNLPWQT